MHTNLILLFKSPLYSSTHMCEVVLSRNSYRNTIGQSSFISFANSIARPLLKLTRFVLLVMRTASSTVLLQDE